LSTFATVLINQQ